MIRFYFLQQKFVTYCFKYFVAICREAGIGMVNLPPDIQLEPLELGFSIDGSSGSNNNGVYDDKEERRPGAAVEVQKQQQARAMLSQGCTQIGVHCPSLLDVEEFQVRMHVYRQTIPHTSVKLLRIFLCSPNLRLSLKRMTAISGTSIAQIQSRLPKKMMLTWR